MSSTSQKMKAWHAVHKAYSSEVAAALPKKKKVKVLFPPKEEEVAAPLSKKKVKVLFPPKEEEVAKPVKEEKKVKKSKEPTEDVIAMDINDELRQMIEEELTGVAKEDRETYIDENYNELVSELGGGYGDFDDVIKRLESSLKYSPKTLVKGMKSLREYGYTMFDEYIEKHSGIKKSRYDIIETLNKMGYDFEDSDPIVKKLSKTDLIEIEYIAKTIKPYNVFDFWKKQKN